MVSGNQGNCRTTASPQRGGGSGQAIKPFREWLKTIMPVFQSTLQLILPHSYLHHTFFRILKHHILDSGNTMKSIW